MKYLDKVKVVKIRKNYEKDGISIGEIGVIWEPEIRDESFYVLFDENKKGNKNFYKNCVIKIEDLELVEEGECDDELLIKDITNNNPKWWCKVEDGYIMNLLGEKKNKTPYDYTS